MTIDYTPLIDALNRHSAALEALRQPEPEPRKKKAAPAPAPAPEPESPAAPEQTPEGATLITYQAPEPEQPAAPEPEPEPEPEQPATDDHGITYEQIQAATKPLTVIPEAVAEWKDYLLANYNTRVSRGVEEKHYPALLAKAEELKAKYIQ